MFDWICSPTADCLSCQNKKAKPKHVTKVSLEERQGDTTSFYTMHNDNDRTLHPPINRNTHCFLKIDSSSRFLMVYPVTNTGAQGTNAAVEKRILSFGIPQCIINDRRTVYQHGFR